MPLACTGREGGTTAEGNLNIRKPGDLPALTARFCGPMQTG